MATKPSTQKLRWKVIETQISLVPRGRSTAQVTLVTPDPEFQPFSLNLTKEQSAQLEGLILDWMKYQEEFWCYLRSLTQLE